MSLSTKQGAYVSSYVNNGNLTVSAILLQINVLKSAPFDRTMNISGFKMELSRMIDNPDNRLTGWIQTTVNGVIYKNGQLLSVSTGESFCSNMLLNIPRDWTGAVTVTGEARNKRHGGGSCDFSPIGFNDYANGLVCISLYKKSAGMLS